MGGNAVLCLCLGRAAASNVADGSLSNRLCNQMSFERSQGSARVSVNRERDLWLAWDLVASWVQRNWCVVFKIQLFDCSKLLQPIGHYMYSTVVNICTASLTFSNPTFCPHCVFICLVWIWEQTAIISLYSINWLFFYNRNAVCSLRGTYLFC